MPAPKTHPENAPNSEVAGALEASKSGGRLPDFVVLGQGKAGTSSMYRHFQARGDVGLCKPKELHFFNLHFEKGAEWYTQHFSKEEGQHQLVGEVSPSYLTPEAVKRCVDLLGTDRKYIVTLRRPIEQAYSRYVQNLAAGRRPGAFQLTVVRLQERSKRKLEALQCLHEMVPSDNILILQFEQDIAVPEPGFPARLAEFLALEPMGLDARPPSRRVNAGVMPRYLWSGDKSYKVSIDDQVYRIPAKTLLFCAQERNSRLWRNPDMARVSDAFAQQSRWTPVVPEDRYARLQEGAVLACAEALEQEFGLDLEHWRCAPKRLGYPLAEPTARLMAQLEKCANA